MIYNTRTLIRYNKLLRSKIESGNASFILLDEGVVQLIPSIPHEKKIVENKTFLNLMKNIKEVYCNTVFVDCKLEKEEVIKRIRKRNSSTRRFDRLESEDLSKLLDVRLSNMITIMKNFQINKEIFEINMNDIDENRLFIHSLINQGIDRL